jgi:hypothetical protein
MGGAQRVCNGYSKSKRNNPMQNLNFIGSMESPTNQLIIQLKLGRGIGNLLVWKLEKKLRKI